MSSEQMNSISLGDYPGQRPALISPSRQPTAESQRDLARSSPHPLRRFYSRLFSSPQDPDPFEENIKRKAERQNNKEDLSRFFSDYHRLKSRPGAKISECLVWYKSFAPNTTRPPAQWFEPEPLRFAADTSFSACIQQLAAELRSDPSDKLQICAIAAEPNDHILSQTFSFTELPDASALQQLGRLQDAPRRLLAVLLNQDWIYPLNLGDFLSPERGAERKSWRMKLPSSKRGPSLLDLSDPGGKQLALTWQSRAPIYGADFLVDVWQNHRDPPKFEYADIFLLSSQRVMISFKSSQLLRKFASLRLDQSILGSDLNNLHPWSPTSEALISILTVYRQIIEDSGVFIRESMQVLVAMKFKGRHKPTASKVRYLVHLDDCRLVALQGIIDSLSLLARVSAAASRFQNTQPLWDAGTPFHERFETTKKDLVYLHEELKHTGERIKELQTMLHDHLNLAQNQRAFLVTIVAALYVPLSFLSGIFGMNITNNSPQDFSCLSSLTNSSLANLTATSFNQTASIISALVSSSGRTWGFKYYILLSIPLLLTIPFCLVAGGIIRSSMRLAIRYAGLPIFVVSRMINFLVYMVLGFLFLYLMYILFEL